MNKGNYKNAWPYKDDKMQLPVPNIDEALSFYETILGFRVDVRNSQPVKSVQLSRDDISIGLAENGGDPSNEGCFFEVENVDDALEELKVKGYRVNSSDITTQNHGATKWRVFFVIAPDGLCFCIGEKQE